MYRMKNMKILLTITIALAIPALALAQNDAATELERDQTIAEKGQNLTLEAEKGLLDVSESTPLRIRMLIYPKGEDGRVKKDSVPFERILGPGNLYYKFANWKVVEGGGLLVGIDEATQNFTAPKTLPAGKKCIVSVELVPLIPSLPKVILFETIQIADSDNLVIINIPGIGLKNARYTTVVTDAVKIPAVAGVDPRVMKNLPPGTLEKLESAKKMMENERADIDLQALSSNVRSFYDAKQDLSVYTISGLKPFAAAPKPGTIAPIDEELSFSFKGWNLGRHPLDSDDQTGINLFLRSMNNGAGCGELHTESFKAICGGEVIVQSLTPDFSKGILNSAVYSADAAGNIVRGRIHVKFKVRRSTN